MADGETIADPDWDAKDGHYRVRLETGWIDVLDDALITEPNLAVLPRFGRCGPTIKSQSGQHDLARSVPQAAFALNAVRSA
jgi:hypothetical protein